MVVALRAVVCLARGEKTTRYEKSSHPPSFLFVFGVRLDAPGGQRAATWSAEHQPAARYSATGTAPGRLPTRASIGTDLGAKN